MANGVEHATATLKMGAIVSVVGLAGAVYVHPVVAGMIVGGWLAHIVTPDLDHHATTYTEHIVKRNVPAPVWILWQIYWYPYEKLSPHRGLSHHWPAGTLIRLVYALWAPILASVYILGIDAPEMLVLWWLSFFVGWSAQDWTHIWMDGLTFSGRRRRWFAAPPRHQIDH